MLTVGPRDWIRSRRPLIVAVALSGLLVAGGAAWVLHVRENRLVDVSVRGDAEQQVGAIGRELGERLAVFDALTAYYDGSEKVEPGEFTKFVARFLRRYPDMLSLSMARRIPSAERPKFEARVRKEQGVDYQIRVWDARGRLAPAGPADEYFPIEFLESPSSKLLALGLDLAAEKAWMETIRQAVRTGEPAVTEGIPLDPESKESRRVLFVSPIYAKGAPTATPDQREAGIERVVLGEFNLGGILKSALRGTESLGVDVRVFEVPSGGGRMLLAAQGSPARNKPFDPAADPFGKEFGELGHEVEFPIGGRMWLIGCTPTDVYLASRRGWVPLATLVAGLVVTGLLVLYINTFASHAARIEQVVVERTHELKRANRNLAQEIADRQRAEAVLKDSEALYASLVENLPVQVLRKDLNGKFTFANRSFCQLLGKPAEEILGKSDFDFYPADLAEKYRHDDRGVAETGRIFEDTEQYEKDGEIRYVHVMKSPVRDAAGNVVETQVVFWDVTAQKSAEEHREQA
jgi:PAS domain S-box-containing protein